MELQPGSVSKRHAPLQDASLWLKLTLYAASAVMLFFSLYYWKLRSGFSDTPNYIVNITRNNGFEIAHSRFVSVVNQWLPVLLMKLGAPMTAIGIGYSLGYTLAPVIMMLLALHWLRQPAMAVAILLLFTLMNSLLFYYTCSELQMGLGLLLLYNGILDYYLQAPDRRRRSFAVSSILLLPTILFAHPMMFPAFACWLLFRIRCRRQPWQLLLLITACVLSCYVVKNVWFTNSYESGKGLSWDLIRPFGLNYFGGGLSQSFYSYVLNDAFLVPVLLLLTIGLLIAQRNWRLLTTTLLSVAGLYTVVIIVYEDLNGMHVYDHYYEHYLQPAVLFMLLGLTDAVFRLKLDQRLLILPLGAVLTISFAKINNGSEWLAIRQKWELSYLKLMDRLGLKKAIAGRAWAPDGIWIGSFWSAPNESLFLSALEGPEHAKTLFLVWNIHDFKEPYQQTDAIMMDGSTYPQASLPARYFRLNDKPYVILENIVPDSVLETMRWP